MASIAFGIAALVLAAVVLAKQKTLAILVLAAMMAGACLGSSAGAALNEGKGALECGTPFDAEIQVLEDSKESGRCERALARIAAGYGTGTVVIVETKGLGETRYGETVTGRCTLGNVPEKTAEYAWQKGAAYVASMTDAGKTARTDPLGALIAVRNGAIDALGAKDDAGALLQALVCGYRRNIRDTERYASFQACGLAHLVAVSGAHLVIVTGLAASVLRSLRVSRRVTVVVLVAIMGSYLVVAGMPVSAMRAVAMSGLGLTSFFARRRSSSMNALGIGIIVMVGLSPTVAISASFVLSALATGGIIVFRPLFAFLLGRTPLGRLPIVVEPLALTLGANLLSQPYSCALFCQLPLASPIANVICSPLFPIVCSLGLLSAIAGLAAPPVASAVQFIAAGSAGALEWLVGCMASVPYACVPCSIGVAQALALSASAAIMLWVLWPCRPVDFSGTATVIAATFITATLLAGTGGDEVIMLDVGQGDSFLISSRGETLLVDTGNQDKLLLEQLGSLHVAHIDNVLVTHADDDHCGSLDVLARTVDIDRVIVAHDMADCDDESCKNVMSQASRTARETVTVGYGDSFEIGAFEARVVWPHAYRDNGGNADSLCFAVSYDGDDDGSADFTSLFTGDAEADELSEMIRAGDVGAIDLLKVGHHGSKNGMDGKEVEVLSPKVALIGVGKDNRYGHPAQQILDMLGKVGCQVYRSDENGQVRCVFTRDAILVT